MTEAERKLLLTLAKRVEGLLREKANGNSNDEWIDIGTLTEARELDTLIALVDRESDL